MAVCHPTNPYCAQCCCRYADKLCRQPFPTACADKPCQRGAQGYADKA